MIYKIEDNLCSFYRNEKSKLVLFSITITDDNKMYFEDFIKYFFKLPKWKRNTIVNVLFSKDLKCGSYYAKVWYYSLKAIKKVPKEYNRDHIIPISYGFKNDLCPRFIGSSVNLQVIHYKENLKKAANITDIVLEKLKEYEQYEKNNRILATDLIHYSKISEWLAGNTNSIQRDKLPKKYESRVRELEELVQHWVENRSSIRYKEVKENKKR